MDWIKYCCLVTCTFLLSLVSLAQLPSPDRYRFVDVKLQGGIPYYSGDIYMGTFGNPYGAMDFRYGWHTKGNSEWEGAYNYPSYGIGWYLGYVNDIYTVGIRNALYGFMSFPLTDKSKRNVLMIEPALGLSCNPAPYNPVTDITNYRFGARFTVYFNLNFGGELKLSPGWDLIYGVDLTHFSNGRTINPNFGLNMMGLNIGTRYHFNRAQKKADAILSTHSARPHVLKTRKPTSIHAGGVQLFQGFGTVQNYPDEATANRYLTSSTVLDWYYHFSEMHGITAGVDAFIDKSVVDVRAAPLYQTYKTTFFPGAHIGYGFMWWRFTASVQIGYHLSEAGREMKNPMFTRPAVRYDLTKHLFVQIGLKTYHGARADWIELGLGISIPKVKH